MRYLVSTQGRIAVRRAGCIGVIDERVFRFACAHEILLARGDSEDEGQPLAFGQFLGG